MIAGLTAIMGLVLIALPVGIIATAFAEVIHRREFVVTWNMVAKVPVFAHLDAAAIAEIIDLLHSRNVARGEVIVRRGEKAHAMFFIVSGEVKVELHENDHPRLAAGDFFGEVAILYDQARSATVRACEDTKLLVLQAHDLELLMDRVPAIGRHIRDVADKRATGRAGKPGRSSPLGDAD
jgi:voltage-gated potassium channel